MLFTVGKPPHSVLRQKEGALERLDRALPRVYASMGVTEAVGETLGVPEPSARFLLALFSAYPIAFAYRAVVSKQVPQAQNLFFTVSGLWVMYFIYGVDIWHSFLDVILVYLILLAWGGTLAGVTLTWIITMGHLLLGYINVFWSDEVHPIKWTIPHCVLVLKLIGLSFNLYDARKNPEKLNQDMKKCVVHEFPSFLEVTGFSYFCGSVLAGPQISFERYRSFVNRKLFDLDNTPSSVPAGLQRMLLGVSFSVVYSVLHQYYPITYLATDQFAGEAFIRKLWLVFISGKVELWRYVTVWLFAEGSCIVTGITYGGVDKQGTGRVEWNAVTNVFIIKNELCITLQGVIDSFNVNTNQWVALYAFKRLRWVNNKMISYIITLTFVSLWHGVWPGYFLNFYFELLGIAAERTFISSAKHFLGCSLYELRLVFQIPLTVLAYILRNLVLMYPLTCFMLLTWEQCYKFMSAVYFYGHVLLISWILIYVTVIRILQKPRVKVE